MSFILLTPLQTSDGQSPAVAATGSGSSSAIPVPFASSSADLLAPEQHTVRIHNFQIGENDGFLLCFICIHEFGRMQKYPKFAVPYDAPKILIHNLHGLWRETVFRKKKLCDNIFILPKFIVFYCPPVFFSCP